MKKNILPYCLLIITIILFTIVTYYKFTNISSDNSNDNNEEQIKFNRPDQQYTYDTDYYSLYGSYIINETILQYDFTIQIEQRKLEGSIYIDSDKKLYLLDKTNNNKKQIINEKRFKTLYRFDTENSTILSVYALSDEGKIYLISLYSMNIQDVMIRELQFPTKVDKFTNLQLKKYSQLKSNSVIVYGNDKKMYDAISGVEYSENILNVFNEYIIYEDNCVSDMSGKMIIDSNGRKIKVKNIIMPVVSDEVKFEGNPTVIFISDNNKLIYLINEEDIYEYEHNVTNIKYDSSTITIDFSDKSTLKFPGILDLRK